MLEFESSELVGTDMERSSHNVDEIKIFISQLSNGLHEYHFSCESDTIGLDGNFTGKVDVDAVLDKTTHQIYLKTVVRARGLFQCDRCVEEFEQPISSSYNMFYVFDEPEIDKYPAEEVQYIRHDTVYLDITDDVRQMILLSVPLKLLCREDCKGLCPHCGTNWNRQSCKCKEDAHDSRWDGLKKLMKN
jgi:uncharacterized protein